MSRPAVLYISAHKPLSSTHPRTSAQTAVYTTIIYTQAVNITSAEYLLLRKLDGVIGSNITPALGNMNNVQVDIQNL